MFVTIPGVVTAKVPFEVDPTYRGEHNFYIHGIHVIKVSTFLTITYTHSVAKYMKYID